MGEHDGDDVPIGGVGAAAILMDADGARIAQRYGYVFHSHGIRIKEPAG
jgi:hypothetical protein